jgi:hypothetical protein
MAVELLISTTRWRIGTNLKFIFERVVNNDR